MTAYSVAEAKNRLPKLIDRALQGEEVVITRHGKPVAELQPRCSGRRRRPGTYEWLRRAASPSGRRPHFGRDPGSALRDRQSLSWYLDASLMIPILIKEPASAAVDAFMSSVQQEPWVSDFAAAEVASALSRLVRTGCLEARTVRRVCPILTYGEQR